MDELKVKRRQKQIEDIVAKARIREVTEAELRLLSDEDLTELINTTDDVEIVALAEDEFVRRHVPSDSSDVWGFDDDILEKLKRDNGLGD